MEGRELTTVEGVEQALKRQLGDKYDVAMENCYALLQVKCRMQEQKFPHNAFVSGDNGGLYRLTRYGFRAREEEITLKGKSGVPDEVRKSFLRRIFG